MHSTDYCPTPLLCPLKMGLRAAPRRERHRAEQAALLFALQQAAGPAPPPWDAVSPQECLGMLSRKIMFS